jgi:SAM-dependent methyltransferase
VFEEILMNTEGQFGQHFRNFASTKAWRSTRTDFVRYFSTAKDFQESYSQFAVAFDSRFPRDSFSTSTPVELAEELALQIGKAEVPAESVIDVCAGVGNALFAFAKMLPSSPRVVAIEIDSLLCGVLAARSVIEDIRLEIHVGDVAEILSNNVKVSSQFDVVLCDPPAAGPFSKSQIDRLGLSGARVFGGEASELIWTEIARALTSPAGRAFVLLSESSLGSQASADVNARVHLLQTQQVLSLLELPSGIFSGVSSSRSWSLLVLVGVLIPTDDTVWFVSHDEGLTGAPVTLRESLSSGLESVLEPGLRDQHVNKVHISEIITERGQLIHRFFGSGDVEEELADDIRPADAWSGLLELLRKKTDLANLVLTFDDQPGSVRVDEAVKNKMLKVFSGRSLAAKNGEPNSGVLHIGRSTLTPGGRRRVPEYSAVSNSKFLLQPGDVLLFTSEKRIETTVWTGTAKAAPGVGISVLRIVSPSINPTHLAWALRGRGNVALLSDDGRMRFGVMDRFEFSIPPIGQQTLFAEKLNEIEEVESALYNAISELDEIRQRISTNLAICGMTFAEAPEEEISLEILGFDPRE